MTQITTKTVLKALLCAVLLLALCTSLFACGKEDKEDFCANIDTSREYTEQALDDTARQAYSYATIQNYYTSGDYKVFRVISKFGYKGEIELAILLCGTTVERIVGINIQESINYGAKCFKDSYLIQFYGTNLAEKKVLKGKAKPRDNGDIIYVTSATVTSRAIIDAVNAVAVFINSQQ